MANRNAKSGNSKANPIIATDAGQWLAAMARCRLLRLASNLLPMGMHNIVLPCWSGLNSGRNGVMGLLGVRRVTSFRFQVKLLKIE